MKIIAAANTPVEVDVDDSLDTTLMIPFHGQCVSNVEKTQHRWRAGESAMFLPAMSRGGGSGTRATLTLDLSPERLQQVARSMLGVTAETHIDLQIHTDQVLALRTHGVGFDEIFKNLCGVVDTFLPSPKRWR